MNCFASTVNAFKTSPHREKKGKVNSITKESLNPLSRRQRGCLLNHQSPIHLENITVTRSNQLFYHSSFSVESMKEWILLKASNNGGKEGTLRRVWCRNAICMEPHYWQYSKTVYHWTKINYFLKSSLR